jgi:hypothetical protein
MADCECLERCVFFQGQMASMPATAEVARQRYCRGDYTRCARYVVYKALGREHVPGDLFPNELEIARQLVAQHQGRA